MTHLSLICDEQCKARYQRILEEFHYDVSHYCIEHAAAATESQKKPQNPTQLEFPPYTNSRKNQGRTMSLSTLSMKSDPRQHDSGQGLN